MTAQNLIELVIEESGIDPAIAQLYLTDALREFCEQTGIVRKRDSFTTQSKSFRHTLGLGDVIAIRKVTKDGVRLINTDQPGYLLKDNGFYFVETTIDEPGIYIGWWDGSAEQKFESGETFDLIYEAEAREFAKDANGAEDFQAEPQIPKRFHRALTYRANEKANHSNPEQRRYWHALWQDHVVKGKKFANSMYTNELWNVKIHTL